MPHIIIEASKNVSQNISSAAMVQHAHNALGEALDDASRIKTRLIVADEVCVGDEGIRGAMVHVTLLLLEGRTIKLKNSYSDAILEAIKPHLKAIPNCKLTCEVRDMDKKTYVL